MSYSLSYLKTHQNCLNTSPTKQIYTFSRFPRFKTSKSNLTCNIDYKNLPVMFKYKEKRGFSFSKLNRSSSALS